MAQIGWWKDREHLSGTEIYQRLSSGVQIGRRQIDILTQQYRILMASAMQRQESENLAISVCTEINSFRTHLRCLSERYWNGLFVCYEVMGVPRTNNDLESLFGDTRRRVRRQSGFKQLRRSLLRQGAWLLYRPLGSRLELQQQLQTVSRHAYRHERIRFQQRQECFRSRYRWQRNSDTVLTNLETQWQQAQRAIFTQ